MKNLCLLLAFLGAMQVSAQITVTNATFPKVGDTLKTAFIDEFTGTLNMGNVGGPQNWDFSALSSGTRQEEVFLNPGGGEFSAAFPDANLRIDNGGQELYMKSSANKIEALGFGGDNPFFDGPLVIKYSKRPVYRAAPLTFISSSTNVSEFRIDLSSSIIPDTLLAGLPIRPDSIRIQFSDNATGLMDAFGSLKMQNKTFDVLREKVQSISETKLFIKIFGAWIDPLPLIGGNIPGGFGGFLGRDTSVTYNFYTNTIKEVLLSASFSLENDLQSLVVADLGGLVSGLYDIRADESVVLFPNPAYDFLRIKCGENFTGQHLVTICDAQGRYVHAEVAELIPDADKIIDVSALSPGSYLLSLHNRSSRNVKTIRFVVH